MFRAAMLCDVTLFAGGTAGYRVAHAVVSASLEGSQGSVFGGSIDATIRSQPIA